MSKFIFLMILSIGLVGLPAEAQEKINQFDSDGNRTGVWRKFHPNKRIRYEGQFVKGKEIGVFKYYSPLSSDHPIAVKTFDENSEIAQVDFYTVKGILQSTGKMHGKNRIEKWLYYHPDGETLMTEEHYVNGQLEGTSKTFFLDGKLTEVSHYIAGKKDGLLKRFSVDGILLDELTYKNGKLHGPAKYFNTDGTLRFAGNYENDQKVGKWEYYENGKPVSTDKIKQQ